MTPTGAVSGHDHEEPDRPPPPEHGGGDQYAGQEGYDQYGGQYGPQQQYGPGGYGYEEEFDPMNDPRRR